MNFYLHSLEKPTITPWYGEQVLRINSIRKVVSELLKSAKLDGYFMNHSLCRSGTSRLFKNGVERKLIKEFTGHRSDAVDAYAITSEAQRESMSKILHCEKNDDEVDEVEIEPKKSEHTTSKYKVTVSDESGGGKIGCICRQKSIKIDEADQFGRVISDIVRSNRRAKATIKVEIVFNS